MDIEAAGDHSTGLYERLSDEEKHIIRGIVDAVPGELTDSFHPFHGVGGSEAPRTSSVSRSIICI
jgi:hypothetical protein